MTKNKNQLRMFLSPLFFWEKCSLFKTINSLNNTIQNTALNCNIHAISGLIICFILTARKSECSLKLKYVINVLDPLFC